MNIIDFTIVTMNLRGERVILTVSNLFGLLRKGVWPNAKILAGGLSDETFPIHLKECEFRWNNKDLNLYKILLKLLRHSPLK